MLTSFRHTVLLTVLALCAALIVTATALADGELGPDSTPPTVTLLTPLPANASFTSTSSGRLQFAIADDNTGIDSAKAWFNSRQVALGNDYSVDTSKLVEGKSRLILLVTDRAGNSTVFSQEMTVDRTAPVLTTDRRHVFGPFAVLKLIDPVSGPVQPIARVRLRQGGVNDIAMRVRDRAGNVIVRHALIMRHVSLGTPRWNRGFTMMGTDGKPFSPNAYYIMEAFRWQGDTVKYAKFPFSRPLVQEVQWRLRLFGALDPAHGLTGVIDKSTVFAVRKFQRSYGITVNGTIGPATRRALDRMVLEYFAPGAARSVNR